MGVGVWVWSSCCVDIRPISLCYLALIALPMFLIYTQAFLLVTDTIQEMNVVFDEIQELQGGPKLPSLI